jgi:mannosyltransferase
MGLVQELAKRISSVSNASRLDGSGRGNERLLPRMGFFRRRIRLKGSSNISVPLAALLLFPIVVVILIIVLVVQHPSSQSRVLMPAGAPPSIR